MRQYTGGHDVEAVDFHKDPDEPEGVQEVRPIVKWDVLATEWALAKIRHQQRDACFLRSNAVPRECEKL